MAKFQEYANHIPKAETSQEHFCVLTEHETVTLKSRNFNPLTATRTYYCRYVPRPEGSCSLYHL